jgi:ubiquinone/menaquinone biosynthesis C-methylase UbiE
VNEASRMKAAYDRLAGSYDEVRFRKRSRQHVDRLIRDFVCERIKPGRRVLELGCGTGRITSVLLEIAENVTAVDISYEMIRATRSKLGDLKALNLIQSDIFELEEHLPLQAFDAVVSLRLLPHIREIDRALGIITSFAAPGGHLLFDLWNSHSLLGLGRRLLGRKHVIPVFYHTYSEMLQLIESSGLEIECEMPLWIYPRVGRFSFDCINHPIFKRYARSLVFDTRKST